MCKSSINGNVLHASRIWPVAYLCMDTPLYVIPMKVGLLQHLLVEFFEVFSFAPKLCSLVPWVLLDSTLRLHCAITQKAPIIFGRATSLSTGTPNFFTNVSSHSFLLSSHTESAISTVDVALAIWMRGTKSIKVEQILPLANAAKSVLDMCAGRVYA